MHCNVMLNQIDMHLILRWFDLIWYMTLWSYFPCLDYIDICIHTYLLTRSLTYLLIYQLTYLLTYLLSFLLTHSFIYSLIYSLTHLFTHSFTHSLIYLLTHLFTHSFIYSLIYLLTHSFIYSLIYSLTHLFTHSFTHLLIYLHPLWSSGSIQGRGHRQRNWSQKSPRTYFTHTIHIHWWEKNQSKQ